MLATAADVHAVFGILSKHGSPDKVGLIVIYDGLQLIFELTLGRPTQCLEFAVVNAISHIATRTMIGKIHKL